MSQRPDTRLAYGTLGAMEGMRLAQAIAPAYADAGKVSAVVAAGSVGRCRADSHSDLELDVYWSVPPTDADRRGVVDVVGGVLETLWDYAPDEGEWSKEFTLHGRDV